MTEENEVTMDGINEYDEAVNEEAETEAVETEVEEIEGTDDEEIEESVEESSEETPEDDSNVISEEQLDEIADTAIAALKDVLKYFNVGEVTIDEYEGDEGELILDITGDDLAVLIGRHGRTLDALQFLISAITVRKIGFRYPVIIDVESYKTRQRQKLESLAASAANRAASQGRSVKMRSMTPYERRIIHVALRDDPRVETASEGEGTSRHVVVVPVK